MPAGKRIEIALRYIYGIGPTRATEILKKTQIDPGVRATKLTEEEISRIAGIIENDYVVEGQLRRQVQQNIARLREIRCYRGLRHMRVAGARAADEDQRADPQGAAQDRGRQEGR